MKRYIICPRIIATLLITNTHHSIIFRTHQYQPRPTQPTLSKNTQPKPNKSQNTNPVSTSNVTRPRQNPNHNPNPSRRNIRRRSTILQRVRRRRRYRIQNHRIRRHTIRRNEHRQGGNEGMAVGVISQRLSRVVLTKISLAISVSEWEGGEGVYRFYIPDFVWCN